MADITDRDVPRRRWWSRRGRPGDDSVEIAGDSDHAWWAEREGIDEVPHGRRRRRAADAAPDAAPGTGPGATNRSAVPGADLPPFETVGVDPSYWSPESLFASSSEAEDPFGSEDADRWTRTRREPVRAAVADDPWEILGLDTSVPWSAVVHRHRDLAKRFHPDRHGTSGRAERAETETRMAEINAAFDELRRIYRATSG
ncbi:MAG TPA: J domain-containing protein [Acidimicrobiales bacterium]|nr:J domain-containing protein [Acidimicrobiales bacterium]